LEKKKRNLVCRLIPGLGEGGGSKGHSTAQEKKKRFLAWRRKKKKKFTPHKKKKGRPRASLSRRPMWEEKKIERERKKGGSYLNWFFSFIKEERGPEEKGGKVLILFLLY